jgi:uncharacterized protein with PIN domain
MHCDIVQNILEEYLEDELDEIFRREVESHLQSCSYCQRELAMTERIANFIKVIPDPQVPEEIYENVMTQVCASQKQPTTSFSGITDALKGGIHYIGDRFAARKWQVATAMASLLLLFAILGGYYIRQKATVSQQPYTAETDVDPQQVAMAVEDIKFALSIVQIATKKTELALAKLPSEMGIDTASRKAFDTVREVDAKASERVLGAIRKGLIILTKSRSILEVKTNKQGG